MSKTSAGIRTISLRIAGTEEAKNEIADLGEDIDDYVVRTKSKTDQIIRDYTAVASNNYKGVSVLDDNGNLRDTYDILLDIAKVYKEIQETDKKAGTNRANALVETLAGKNRSNIAASILQNPELLEQAYTASQHSEGVGQKELDIYLDSVAAKMETLKNHLQELATVTIDSEWLKDLVDLGTGAVKTVTKLTKVFGGLNTIIGAISGFMLQKNGFGLASFDKVSGRWISLLGKIKQSNAVFKESKASIDQFTNSFGKEKMVGDLINPSSPLGIGKQLKAYGIDSGFREYIKNMTDAERATTSLGEAQENYLASLSVGTKIAKGFGSIITSVFSTAGTMLIAMAASALISKGIQLVSDTIHAHENTIKAGNEASSEADQSRNEIKKINAATSAAEKRYNQLRKGVYMNGSVIQNLSLSSDEYAEFLNINEQLAETFPSLITGITDGGQSLVDLGENASEATQKLTELSDAAKQIHINDIKEEMPKIVSGLLEQNEDFDKSIQDSQKQIQGYQEVLDTLNSIDEQYAGGEGSFSVTINDKEARKSLESYLDNSNVDYTSTYDTIDFTFFSDEEYERFSDSIKGYKNLVEGDIQGVQNQIKATESERQANWGKQFVPNLIEVLENDPNFLKMGDTMTNLITSKLPEFDWSSFFGGSSTYDSENAISDVINQVIKPIELALDEGKVDPVDVSKVFNFDWDNATNEEIIGKTNEVLQTLFPDEEIRQQVAVLLDIMYEDENGLHYTVTKERNDFYEMFGGKVTGYDPKTGKYTRDDSNARISWNDIMKVGKEDRDFILGQADQGLVNLDTIKNYDELIAKIQELRQTQAEVGTQTLADVLKDEAFSDSASNIESRITALKTAMDSLMETGELKGDGLADLLEAVPEFKQLGEELTDDDISNAMVDNIHEWIKLFDETVNSKDLSNDAKKAAQNYKKAFVEGFLEDTPITDEQAKKTMQDLFGSLVEIDGEGTMENAQEYARQMQRADIVYSKLQEEFGADFDAKIVEMILDVDPSMATATTEQWIATYKDYAVELKIDADTALAEAKIERLKNAQSLAKQRIEDKKRHGELVENEDYSPIYESIDGQIEDLRNQQKEALKDRSENKYKARRTKSRYSKTRYQTNAENATAKYLDLQTQIEALEAERAQTRQEQEQENLNYLQNQLSQTESLGKEIAQERTKTESKGQAISHRLAKQQANNNLAQIAAQQSIYDESIRLADVFSNPVNKELYNPELAIQMTEQAIAAQEAIDGLYQNGTTARGILADSNIAVLSDELTDIQNQASEINDLITLDQAKGLKANEREYKNLANLSRQQARNLADQNKQLRTKLATEKNLTAEGRQQLEDQIRQNESSMAQALADAYGYDNQARNLLLTQAQDLSSAIQSAFSEMATPTGITPDTIQAISTAFSDLGSSADLAGVFYNTTDGVKANVIELKRLAQQEYELSNNKLTEKINDTTAAINRMENASGDINTAGINKLKQDLADLQQQQSQVFATYQQLMEQFSQHGQIALADQTTNQGANYDKALNYLKEAKEMWDKGLIGTDDYKTRAAYFDEWGLSDPTRFKQNYDKFSKYMTDDIQGVHKFMMDLQSAGMATLETYEDGTQGLVMNFTDLAKAAHQFGAGEEWFRDMFGKAEEYGGMGAFVSSMEDAQLQTQKWTNELTNAQLKYAEMKREGASVEDLALQQDVIDTYRGQLNAVQTATENFQKGQKESYIKGFQDLKQNIKDLGDLAKENPEGFDRLLKEAQSLADKYGVKIDGEFNIDEASYADAQKRIEDSIKPAIDLKARPQVTSDDLRGAGWDVEGNGNGTVFTSSYSDENGQTVVMTPILPNGDVLEPESLEYYAEQILSGKTGEIDGIDMSSLALRTYTGKDSVAQADRYSESLHRMQDAWYNNADMQQEMATALKDYSYEELQAIDYMDHAYSTTDARAASAEKSVDSLMDKFQLTGEYAHEFIDAMKDMGLLEGLSTYEEQAIDFSNSIGAATDKVEALFKGTRFEGATQFDAASMSVDELQNKLAEISEMKAQINVEEEGGQEAMDQLNQLEAKTQREYQIKLSVQQMSDKEVNQFLNADYETQIDIMANMGYAESDYESFVAMVEAQQVEAPIKVKLDEGSLQGINEAVRAAINGEDYKKEVTLEPIGQDKVQSEAEKPATKKVNVVYEVVQKARDFVGGVVGAVSNLFGGGSSQTVSASLDTNAATTALNALKAEASNIPVKLDIDGAVGQIDSLKSSLDEIRNGDPIQITAENDDAIGKIEEVKSKAESANPKIKIGGENDQAKSSIDQVVALANRSVGRIKISADRGQATSAVMAAVSYANGRTAKIKIGGNTSDAISAANDAVARIRRMIANISINANVRATVTGTVVRPTRPTSTPSRPSGHTNYHAGDATHYNTAQYSGTLSSIGRGYAKGTFDEDGKVKKSGTAYNMLNYKDMTGFAKGDIAIDKDQESLINELGTESIIRNGKWFLVPGGPHIENLKRGDVVFNHKQTEDLLKQGRTSSHARIIGGSSAFANGTVNGMSAFAGGTFTWTGGQGGQINVTVSGSNNNVNVGSGNQQTTTGSGNDNSGNATDNTDKPQFSYDIFDYVELRLQYFADKTKAVADRITDYINKATKKALLDKQIKAIQTEIKANSRAASTYMDFAEKLAQAYSYTDKDGNQATVNIWSKFKRKDLLQGKYQLDQMVTTNPKDAALVEGARAYLDYINKARDANNAIQELANTMRELQDQIIQIPTEKLERTLEIIENRISTITGISSAMSSGMSGIKAAQRWINEATGVTKAREDRDEAVAAAEAKKEEAEKKQKSSADDLANKKKNYDKWSANAAEKNTEADKAIKKLRLYNNNSSATQAQKDAIRKAINSGRIISDQEMEKLGIRGTKLSGLKWYINKYNSAISARDAADKNKATAKRLLDKAKAQNEADQKAVNDAKKVVEDTRKAGNNVVAAEKKRRSAQAGTLMGIGRNSPSYIVQNEYLDVELDRMKKELEARLATQREQEGVTNTLQSQKTKLTGEVNKIKNTSEYKKASKSDKTIIDNAIKNGTKIDPTKVSSALSQVVSEWNNNILSLANVTTALQQAKDQEEKMKEELTQSALEVAEREQKIAEEKMENITNWYKAAIDYAKTQADTFSKMRNVWKERGYYISMEDLNNDSEQIDRHKTSLYDGIRYIYRQFAKTANKEQTYGPVTEFTAQTAAKNIKNNDNYKNASAADKKIIDDAMKSSSEIDITKLSSKWSKTEDLSILISEWNKGITSSVFKLNQNYKAQIGKLQQMQKGYEEMVQKQTEQLEDMVAKGTILRGTEEHKKMLTDIEDAKTEVWALDGEIQKLYDSMREDVYFKPIENAIKQTETLRKATDQLKGFISQEMMYTTDGMFTKLGTVKYTMDVQSYKQAQDQLTQIIQEQQVINERFTLDRSFSMEEYMEKMQALEAQYRDTMGNLVSYRQAIIKDVTDRYQTEVTYINKLIDAQKNEINKKKELYDYDKKLRKQNKDVQLIEQQIRALNGLIILGILFNCWKSLRDLSLQ